MLLKDSEVKNQCCDIQHARMSRYHIWEACNLWAVLTACAHAQPPLPDTAAQRYQDWVAAGGTTDRHVISALRAALEGVKRKSSTASFFGEKSGVPLSS